LGLAVAAVQGLLFGRFLLSATVLIGYALWRRHQRGRSIGLWAVVWEFFVVVGVVGVTGYWASPFVFCLITVVVAAGFARGYYFALAVASAQLISVGLPLYLTSRTNGTFSLQATGQWAVELVLLALLSSYSRRLFGEAEKTHSAAIDRMNQLSEANSLLISLHRVAQSLPATLNLDEVLSSTVKRLRAVIECDVAAVLLRDESDQAWTVAMGDGIRLGRSITDDQLPTPLRAARTSSVASLVVCLDPGEGLGLDILSRSGLYAPLRARGALLGLVALEHHEPGRYGRQELRLLDGFVGPAALAIDNARWFSRLRAMGADQERTRIARDMHDRVGQSLAYLGFKLDRLAKSAEGEPFHPELAELRTEVRGVLAEVRDTLSDLRTDVSDGKGLADTLQAYLDRVAIRAKLEVVFRSEGSQRLPLVQEREVWRIAQEAIANVERHARARTLTVSWSCDEKGGLLTVADDGRGFAVGTRARHDSYGLSGMNERADAIGARLEVTSGPETGTVVRCRVPVP